MTPIVELIFDGAVPMSPPLRANCCAQIAFRNRRTALL
jgi:hypothetical protein